MFLLCNIIWLIDCRFARHKHNVTTMEAARQEQKGNGNCCHIHHRKTQKHANTKLMMRKIKVDGEPPIGIHPLQTASVTFEPRCVRQVYFQSNCSIRAIDCLEKLISEMTLLMYRFGYLICNHCSMTLSYCMKSESKSAAWSRSRVSYLKETPTPGPICFNWTFV